MQRPPVGEQLVELALEHVEPPVEAAVREQLVGELDRAQLQAGEAAKELAARASSGDVPAEHLERLEENPAALRVDRDGLRDEAGEPRRQPLA